MTIESTLQYQYIWLSRFIIDHIYKDYALFWKDVVLCFYRSHSKEKTYFIINLLIILAKFHVHKCKFSAKKPNFVLFSTKLYIILS